MKPSLSIVIVNFNGFSFLKDCLDSIFQNTFKNYEVIVVDNGSTDDSVKKIYQKYKNKVNLIQLSQNYGPSYARNKGVKIAKGDYIAFFDNDTKIDKNCFHEAITEFKNNNSIGIIQTKLVMMDKPHLLDCTGEYLGQNGFLVHRNEIGIEDKKEYNHKEIIFAPKSAGMFIRKRIFEEIGYLDEDYFIYMEETDFAWRVWLRKYESIFLPTALVYHRFGTSSIVLSPKQNDYNAKYHGSKNYILTLLKNLELVNIVKIVPIHILLWIGLAYFALSKGRIHSFLWIHKGIFWNIVYLPQTIKKRKEIQNRRLVKDKDIFPKIMKKKNLMYYIKKVTTTYQIGSAEGFFKTK